MLFNIFFVTLKLKFLNSLEYKNEAGGDPPDKPATSDNCSEMGDDQQKEFSISTYTTHHITMEGITFYTEEFRIDNHDSMDATEKLEINAEKLFTESCVTMVSQQFYSTISELPDIEQSCYEHDNLQSQQVNQETEHGQSDSDTDDEQQLPTVYHSDQIMFGEVRGLQEIRIKMKVRAIVNYHLLEFHITFLFIYLCYSKRKMFPDQKFN